MTTPNVSPQFPLEEAGATERSLMIVGGTRRRGQPPRHGAPAREHLDVRITKDHKEGLKEIAAAEGRSVAAVVKDAIDEYVGDYRERKIFATQNGSYRPE